MKSIRAITYIQPGCCCCHLLIKYQEYQYACHVKLVNYQLSRDKWWSNLGAAGEYLGPDYLGAIQQHIQCAWSGHLRVPLRPLYWISRLIRQGLRFDFNGGCGTIFTIFCMQITNQIQLSASVMCVCHVGDYIMGSKRCTELAQLNKSLVGQWVPPIQIQMEPCRQC